ncbi:hypothetical protein [Teredinibacter sp. KSP-S5-2]|uniref:hypothetical protein n=1 Tax=Teredinibacter sp. KSP-S5-2 TaxID=3034506 RepID=UPI0029342904|nr:hypothetical protein [Teredinibacter sp. KSP-S5-2]WNO09976.1 hypothetical protein P5V12_02205 [Teredinibacter sp. KSP-S5-2]
MNRKLIYMVVIFVISPSLLAGSGSGHVQIEHVYPPAKLFFYTTNHTNPPVCNTYSQLSSGSKRWVIDLNTELGKQQYSLLLAAQMSNKEVKIGGSDTCNLHPNSEDVSWVGFPVNQ